MDKIRTFVSILSGVLYAIVGVILASRSKAAVPGTDDAHEMDAIMATTIDRISVSGGKGNMMGATFGAILTATIENGLSLPDVSTFWYQVVIGIFILSTVTLNGYASNRTIRNR